MSSGFFKFLQRSADQGDAVAIEARPGDQGSPSMASEWVGDAPPPAAPEPLSAAGAAGHSAGIILGIGWRLTKIASASYLLSTIAGHGLALLSFAAIPAADRALRSEAYAPGIQIAQQARNAGFAVGRHTFGSYSVGDVKGDWERERAPEGDILGEGESHSATTAYSVGAPLIGPITLMPKKCFVRLGSNTSVLFGEPSLSRRFSALHELSHCDDTMGSWARFSPSPAQLNSEQAQVLRLILLADSQIRGDEKEPLFAALTDRAHAEEPARRDNWRRLPATLFGESVADARALLILSRVEPKTWRAAGWELWLQRAAGEDGATAFTAHNHATEEAISLTLSTSDAQLAKLSPKGLDQLAAASASDALVIKLAKQGWHERFNLKIAPTALALALQSLEEIPADNLRWANGDLLNFGHSPERLKADRAWLSSEQGAAAMESLFARLKSIHDNAQVPSRVERLIEGHAIEALITPSAGSFDLRYEGSIKRSLHASLLASAALLQRAIKEGGPQGFKTPSNGIWPHMGSFMAGGHAPLMRHMASRSFVQEFGSKPVYFGYRKTGVDSELSYLVGDSLESVTPTKPVELPALPKLNPHNRRGASETQDEPVTPPRRPKP